jgi:hypothetical protein
MKSDMMLLSFIVLFGLVALLLMASPASAGQGCGSNWLGSDTNDQDFWVSKNQNLGSTSSVLDTASSKPRIPPDERPRTIPSSSGPNMSMPEPLPKPLVAENGTDQESSNETALNGTNAGTTLPSQPPDVGGRWLIKLDNSTDRSLDLILIQTEKSIMTSGSFIANGAEIAMTGHGSLQDKDLTLKVKTVVREYGNQIDKRYDLDLVVENESLSGRYKEYSGEVPSGEGSAYASR